MRSLTPVLAAFTLSGTLVLSSPAMACREYVFPDKLLEPHDAAVLVRVTASGFEGDQSRFYVWRAQARLERVLSGQPDTTDLSFGGGWQSTGCERTKPPPPKGELWVLYFQKTTDGWSMTEAYPLDVARRIDPALSAP